MTTRRENIDRSNAMREAMRLSIRRNDPLKSVRYWVNNYDVSVSQVYAVARDLGLDFARAARTRYPRSLSVTYGSAKYAPRPFAWIPSTAIRAAGLDGERELRLSVEPNRIIIEKAGAS